MKELLRSREMKQELAAYKADPRRSQYVQDFSEEQQAQNRDRWLKNRLMTRRRLSLLDFIYGGQVAAARSSKWVSQDGKPLGDSVFPPFTNLDMGEGVTAAPIIVPSRTDEGTSYIHQQLNFTNTAIKALALDSKESRT